MAINVNIFGDDTITACLFALDSVYSHPGYILIFCGVFVVYSSCG